MGKYLSIWGVRAIFPAGFLIDGGTFVLFGLLQWVEDKTTFLVFSYLIRFIEVRWIEKCCAKRPTLYGHIVLQCFLPYSDPSYSTNSSSLFHYFFDLIKISFFSYQRQMSNWIHPLLFTFLLLCTSFCFISLPLYLSG